MKSNQDEPPRFDLSVSGKAAKAANFLAEQVGLALICPSCNILLKRIGHELGIAWRCTGCGGQSLNFSQFRRMIPALHANEIWLTILEKPAPPKCRTLCPECRKDMSAVQIPYQGKEIELTICPRCQRLWLEKQQTQLRPQLRKDADSCHKLQAGRSTE